MLRNLAAGVWGVICLTALVLLLAPPQALATGVGGSQLVALRVPIVIVIAATTVAAAAIMLVVRLRGRRGAFPWIVVLAVACLTAIHLVQLGGRGFATASIAQAAAPEAGLRIFSWNTGDTGVDDATVAKAAAESRADYVALPETPPTHAASIARIMKTLGRPMWVIPDTSDDTAWPTSLLVSTDIGAYDVVPDSSQTVRGGIVAESSVADLPTIVVAHAQQPGFSDEQAKTWRNHLDWYRSLCAQGNTVIAGDFNATIENLPDGLGACATDNDAGGATGQAGSTATWPTSTPPWFGTRIDHVFATAEWKVERVSVITDLDDSGSDHRPIVADLTRRDEAQARAGRSETLSDASRAVGLQGASQSATLRAPMW